MPGRCLVSPRCGDLLSAFPLQMGMVKIFRARRNISQSTTDLKPIKRNHRCGCLLFHSISHSFPMLWLLHFSFLLHLNARGSLVLLKCVDSKSSARDLAHERASFSVVLPCLLQNDPTVRDVDCHALIAWIS